MMKNRIVVTIATLVAGGAIGLTGVASATSSPARERPSVRCPSVCPHIYDPVVCELSDGSVMKFGNRCLASVYACQKGLKVISCRPAAD